ncbi:MAG TPA: glycosyl hydrolase family 65 protein [Acidimicrobiia bacterium]|nr:glycosyl hydrolase family 65 protein [Acidimicrobiia bacterium]
MNAEHGLVVSELPHETYPIDRWAIVETRYSPELVDLVETVFALGNGSLGVRGSFHQGAPAHQPGALLNGFYETWPIVYPEAGYGFATVGQTIVYVPDPTPIRLSVNGVELDFASARVENWERRLDFRSGTLTHRYRWMTEDGVGVDVEMTRIVSIAQPDLVACQFRVHVDAGAEVTLVSGMVNRQDTDYLEPAASEFDPRQAKNFGRRVLEPTGLRIDPWTMSVAFETVQSHLHVAISSSHILDRPAEATSQIHPDRPEAHFTMTLDAGETATLEKFTVYELGSDRGIDHTEDAAAAAAAAGFAAHLHNHAGAWAEFWETADIHIGTDKAVQQAVRWILFQLHQASVHIDGTGIAAKGVTGQAYEGHYFWDTEIFVLPFLTYSNPPVAAGLLRFRYGMLAQARDRAGELALRGALFPWRSINGHEASAYWAAGTAQYHINADIAYALRKYVEVSGDDELLWEVGVEMLVETARMWADLGFHRDGAFHIYGVTGPDEYTALVDDNAYTNLMAQMNLLYAAEAVERMASSEPERWRDLAARLEFVEEEIDEWRQAGETMYVPFDEGYGITKQDESFLAKERWDFETVAPERYPLLLHFHPLTIYRYQVLKQADVVMATFLQEEKFDPELRRANFEYYDPLTTGDSSLSACVQAIVAAEIGEADLAMRYFRNALFTDLADLHRNTTDGVHLASAGGVWMALVYGMAGMRDIGGRITFDPRLPDEWRTVQFRITVRGIWMDVDLDQERLALRTDSGELEVIVRGTKVTATPSGVSVPL